MADQSYNPYFDNLKHHRIVFSPRNQNTGRRHRHARMNNQSGSGSHSTGAEQVDRKTPYGTMENCDSQV